MANSVPNQVAAGRIDALFRDDVGDGTLGLPDYSPVPYVYAPLLGPADAAPEWVLDQFRQGAFAAFKGNPDGLAALRSTGQARGSVLIQFIPQTTGSKISSPDGTRNPDYTWGPRDIVFALRHPGTTSWTAADVRAYVVLTQGNLSIGMRLTTAAATGPWDAELADSAAIPLNPAQVNVWDGGAHEMYLGCFGSNILAIVDGRYPVAFRAPRAYKRRADGTTDTAVFSTLPTTGNYAGFDTRGETGYLYAWAALQPASGEFFFYDQGATAVQVAPTTTYTPATLPSGETWTITGTATASKNGLLLNASSSAVFTLANSYGLLCTKWGTAVAEGGLVFRRQDANNYYLVTSTGLWRYDAGVGTKIANFTVGLDATVVVNIHSDSYAVIVNGVQVVGFASTTYATAKTVGFLSPAAGTSQFRFIGFQPTLQTAALPTA